MAVDYRQLTRTYARKWKIPEALALAQIGAESNFNPRAVSSAGAQGLAQFMPATAKGVGLRDPFNPHQALDAYGKHMSTLLRNYGGNQKLALAAYNAGGGAVSKYGNKVPPYKETQNYVAKILSQSGAAGPSPQATPVRASGQVQQGVEHAAGVAAPPGAKLALDGRTMKLINKWIASEEKALGAGKPGNEKLWNQVLGSLQRSAVATQEISAAGVTVPASPGVKGKAGKPASSAALTGSGKLSLSYGGGPADHGRRALGDWQSDNAYDLMGKAGDPIYAPLGGTVTNISGKPGGNPGFAGYGITVRTPQGNLFFKHLGSKRVKIGDKITPGMLLGTLDAITAGGPHLHLGGDSRPLLDQVSTFYSGRKA